MTSTDAPKLCRRCNALLPPKATGTVCPACMVASASAFQKSMTALPLEPLAPLLGEVSGAEPVMFGDYLLEEELAHGGMGVVYRARQLSLNRTVAVKLLLLGKYSSTTSLQRFRREAQSAATLQHPGIVAVHEVGETDGQPFIAMEFVPGGSLAERLRVHPLAPREAAEIVRAVAEALHFAHGQGLIHRDVKPSNILFDARGQVRITDFGLAKRMDGSGDLTMTGDISGTPNYLPPEVAAGKADAGAAGDGWSLGAVLYECLTGRPPFLAESLQQTLRSIAENDPVPLRRLNPAVPRDLETVCLKALAREPAQRFPSAQDFAEELARWLRGEPIRTRPASAPERLVKWVRRRPKIAVLIALTLLAVAAVIATLAFANRRIAAAREVAETRGEESRGRLVKMHVAAGARLVADGSAYEALLHFAEALRLDAGHLDREEMHRRRFGAVLSTSPRLADFRVTKNFANAAFSPDGTRIISGGPEPGAWLWERETGRTLLHLTSKTEAPTLGFFTPSGGVITAGADGKLQLRTSDGTPVGAPLPVLVKGGERRTFADCLDVSKDGRWIAATLPQGGARIFEVASGKPQGDVLFPGSEILRLRWSPDGGTLAVCGEKMGAHLVEVATGQTLWTIVPAPETVRLVGFSPDGRLLLTSARGKLDLWRIASRERTCATVPAPGDRYACAFSPDARAVVTTSPLTAQLLDTETGRAFGENMKHATHVMDGGYSPDGRFVMTTGYDGSVRLWDSRDGQPASPWLWCGTSACLASFSPDGRHLLTNSSAELRLWEMPAFTPEAPRFAHADAFLGQTTPEGKRLLTAGGKNLRVWDVATGAEVFTLRVASRLADARLSRDGRTIAAITADGSLHLWDVESGRADDAPRPLPIAAVSLAISPDGRRLLVLEAGGRSLLLGRDPSAAEVALPPLEKPGRSVSFSPDGRFATASGNEGAAVIFDTLKNAVSFRSAGGGTRGAYVHFSADSRRAVVRGNSDFLVRVIDPATGEAQSGDIPHHALFFSTFSPDGGRIVIGPDQSTSLLAHATTGGPQSPLIRDTRPPFHALLSPDGRLLATSSDLGTIQVWEVATGTVVLPPFATKAVVRDFAWSPDGGSVIVTTQKGTHFISVAPARGTPAELLRQAEILSGRKLDADLGLRPLTREEVRERWEKR